MARRRLLGRSAIASSSSWLSTDSSVSLDRYERSRPLMFAQLPRCHRLRRSHD